MKKCTSFILPGILALALVSCQQQTQPNKTDPIFSDIEKLNIKIKELEDAIKLESDKAQNRIEALEKENQQLKIDQRSTQTELYHLRNDINDFVKTMAKANTQNPANPSNPNAQQPVKTDEVRMKALKVIETLKTNHWVDDAAGFLTQYPDVTAPIVFEELKRSCTPSGQTILNDLVQVVARYPERFATDIVQKSISSDNAIQRLAAVDIVKFSASNALSQIIEKYLDKYDEYSKYSIAEALVFCKNKSGVGLLVGGLSAQDMSVRLLCIQALKSKATNGESFGYRFELSPDSSDSQAAIKKWLEWWEANKEKLWANQ